MEYDETKRKISRSPVIEAPVSEVTLYTVGISYKNIVGNREKNYEITPCASVNAVRGTISSVIDNL